MKNKLKIFGIIALVVIIGFSMISCEDNNNNDSIVGTWTASYEDSDGDSVNETIVFKADGTGTVSVVYPDFPSYDGTLSLTWSQDGSTITVTVQGKPVYFTYNGGNSFTVDGITFKRK